MKSIFLFLIFNFSLFAIEKNYSLDYIYVNSNSGQSSGGHSAIRLGDLVYHFQYYPDKIFHIVREPWKDFRYSYGLQENRTIWVQKIKLTQKNYDFFMERFNEVYLIQKKELDNLVKLDNDFKILESLAVGAGSIHLKGAGYFSSVAQDSNDFNEIKDNLKKKLGSNYFLKEQILIRQQLHSSSVKPRKISFIETKEINYPRTIENFSTEYINLLHKLFAYEVLHKELGLKSGSYFEYKSKKKFDSYENFFVKVAQSLEKEILSMLQLNKPNQGYSLLVTIARYQLIKKSIKEKKILILDSFGKNNSLLIGHAISNKLFLTEIEQRYDQEIQNLLNQMESSGNFTERDYTILENLINRKNEIILGLIDSKPIRTRYEIFTPEKEEEVSIYYKQISKEEIHKYLTEITFYKKKYEVHLQKKYSFNLINKNCTTEIFNSINSFFMKGDLESLDKLGGVVKGEDFLVFVPVYAHYSVGKNYKIIENEYIPSLRKIVNKKYSEDDYFFSLRESNTFTSRFYKFNNEDSFFVFFTEDSRILRLPFGIVNLIAGFGELVYGIGSAPFDRGDHFIKGLQGIFFSGPEIVFFNIRKGTFVYAGSYALEEGFGINEE